MIEPFLYALGSVIFVSLISLVGVFALSLSFERLNRIVFFLVALAIGALLGDAFIHLIPEALEKAQSQHTVSILIISGIFLFFFLERVLHWRHEHGHGEEAYHARPLGKLILVSDGMHNFIDGIIIGASYLTSIPVGVATTVAIILHEIPQEMGDFGVLVHSGYTRARALLLNLLSGIVAVLGAVFAFAAGAYASNIVDFIIPIAAGSFIYIATADLVPELHRVKEKRGLFIDFVAIVLGVGAMYLLLFIE